ncbi:MAG: hypothetical protein HC841_09020 [Verrucomicrobiae bacterium]|nr:hypothetical protein [Verrucomicrobiae bacterium]
MTDELNGQLYLLYEMLDKGVIAIPNKDELLSVADLCLGMKTPPSPAYLEDGTNSHGFDFKETVPEKVFDRLGTNWGARPSPT